MAIADLTFVNQVNPISRASVLGSFLAPDGILPRTHQVRRSTNFGRYRELAADPVMAVHLTSAALHAQRFLCCISDRGWLKAFLDPREFNHPRPPIDHHRELLPDPPPTAWHGATIEVVIVPVSDSSFEVWPLDLHRYRGQNLDAAPLAERLALLDQLLAEVELPTGWTRPAPLSEPDQEREAIEAIIGSNGALLCRRLQEGSYQGAPPWTLFADLEPQ
jgi:hypothetical protein